MLESCIMHAKRKCTRHASAASIVLLCCRSLETYIRIYEPSLKHHFVTGNRQEFWATNLLALVNILISVRSLVSQFTILSLEICGNLKNNNWQ